MSPIERLCFLVRHFEGWHDNPRNPGYIGWGHRIQPHERHLNQNITRAQGDSILYSDLHKLLVYYKDYGKHALLLTALSYQVGIGTVCGNKTRPPSRLIQKIRQGRTDIESDYLEFCHYKGKVIPSIRRRRMAELYALMMI